MAELQTNQYNVNKVVFAIELHSNPLIFAFVKIYAYILLLIFSSSVLKAGNIAHLGSQLVVSLFDLNSCESEELSSCSHHENEDDKGCCCGSECHCTCCVHLVFIDSPNASRTIKRPILKEQSTYYQFNYDFDFNSGTFHPPLF